MSRFGGRSEDGVHRTVTQILHLRFRKTGDVYRYFEFSPADYKAFLDAESRGRFFLARIRDHFPYERLAKLHAA
jgi:hypothetical protein